MCGITGFVNFSGDERYEAQARVRRMAGTIAHRGPDREGFYVGDFAALEHRRLAFIDVAAGQAPMGILEACCSTRARLLSVCWSRELFDEYGRRVWMSLMTTAYSCGD